MVTACWTSLPFNLFYFHYYFFHYVIPSRGEYASERRKILQYEAKKMGGNALIVYTNNRYVSTVASFKFTFILCPEL
jgi:hypothetical protein